VRENMECRLCPRECGADRKVEFGFCGAGEKIKIARAELHYGEEPCISGKNGSGTIFFSHCTMKCVFCQNYDISTENKGYEISVDKLSEIMIDLQNKNANNINFVTPTHYVYDIIKAIEKARSKGLKIPIVYNTGGYEKVDTLKLLDGYVDIYLPDIKYYNDKYAVKYSLAKNYFEYASKAVEEMYRQVGKNIFDENGMMKKGVIVRHLLLPHRIFEAKKILDYLYYKYNDNIYISIMSQYTPYGKASEYPELSNPIKAEYYNAVVNYAEFLGIENAFIQYSKSCGEEYIPEFYDKES